MGMWKREPKENVIEWKVEDWHSITLYSFCYCYYSCCWKLMWRHIWVLTPSRMPYYPFEYLFIDYVFNNEYTINLENLVNDCEHSPGSLSSSKYLLFASDQKHVKHYAHRIDIIYISTALYRIQFHGFSVHQFTFYSLILNFNSKIEHFFLLFIALLLLTQLIFGCRQFPMIYMVWKNILRYNKQIPNNDIPHWNWNAFKWKIRVFTAIDDHIGFFHFQFSK